MAKILCLLAVFPFAAVVTGCSSSDPIRDACEAAEVAEDDCCDEYIQTAGDEERGCTGGACFASPADGTFKYTQAQYECAEAAYLDADCTTVDGYDAALAAESACFD